MQPQAVVRSSGRRWPSAKDSFVAIHYRAKRDGQGDQSADTANEHPRGSQQAANEQQAEQLPPVLPDSLAAGFHPCPEIDLLVDDQRQGEYPRHVKEDQRNHHDHGSDGDDGRRSSLELMAAKDRDESESHNHSSWNRRNPSQQGRHDMTQHQLNETKAKSSENIADLGGLSAGKLQ